MGHWLCGGRSGVAMRMLALLLLTCGTALGTMPPITHTAVAVPPGAQMKPGCSPKNLGVEVRGVFYFAPTAGSAPTIVTFAPATKAWGAVPIAGVGAGVVKALAGSTMSGVENPNAGGPDFLVFGGGAGSNGAPRAAPSARS